MATVNNATAPDLFAAYGPQQTDKRDIDDVENRFLAVLVAQMNNQDPLNPLDNAQVTSQLAQINTVKGIEQLNKTVEMLAGRVQSSEQMAALGAVGRAALVPGNSIALYEGEAAAGFELPQKVDGLTITIKDNSGVVIDTVELGAQQAGIHTFVWDGKTPSGATAANNVYKFEIAATRGGKSAGVDTLTLGRIDGLIPNQEEVTFQMGGLPPVKMSDVRQFL
jgi:flagellar basal-body rod modification protein FlgD